jgi:hypothetical protein
LRRRLEGQENLEIADVVACSLQDIEALYRMEESENMLAETIKRCSLVLVSGPNRQELHWKTRRHSVDWTRHKRAWTLMLALAEKSRLRASVGPSDRLGISLKDAKHDLAKYLPRDLASFIKVDRGSYKLNLEPAQVSVVELE